MKNDHQHELDARFHRYLDGELSSSETAVFEGDLRPGTSTESQVRILKHLGAWFRDTRPRAPSYLRDAVVDALDRPRGVEKSAPSLVWPWKTPWISQRLRWVWIPAAAAAIVMVSIIPMSREEIPSDGIPQPSELVTESAFTNGHESEGSPQGELVSYVFTVKAGEASKVCLAGDFNQWKVCEAPLVQGEGNTWSITIELPRGRHEYMFVIDDEWVTDPNAMGYSDDGFGNRNAILVV